MRSSFLAPRAQPSHKTQRSGRSAASVLITAIVISVAITCQSNSPTVRVIGKVVDATGQAVGGATIRVYRSSLDTLPLSLTVPLDPIAHTHLVGTSRTNKNGKYSFHVPAMGPFTVIAEHEKYGISTPDWCSEGRPLDLKIQGKHRLAGRVVDKAGIGTEGVGIRLVVMRDSGVYPPSSKALISFSMTTGMGGAFSFATPGAGRYWLIARKGQCIRRITGELPAGNKDVVLKIEQRRKFYGILTDSKTGKPVAGADVRWAWGSGLGVRSDEHGRYALELEERATWIHVVPEQHQSKVVVADEDALATNSAENAEKVKLHDGMDLKARLLDREGQPLTGAPVILRAYIQEGNQGRGPITWPARLDGNGILRVGCLQKNVMVTLFVLVDGVFAPFLCHVPIADADIGTLRISTSGVLQGRVVLPNGEAAGGATLYFAPVKNVSAAKLASSDTLCRNIQTDPLGRFLVRGLMHAEYHIVASKSGLAPAFVKADVDEDTESLTLQLAVGALLASGQVVDEKGAPIARALVAARPQFTASSFAGENWGLARLLGIDTFWATTSKDGKFVVRGPKRPFGRFHLWARARTENGRPRLRGSGEAEAGATDAKIVVK